MDCYVCPLCGRAFIESAVEEGVLTLEHVPPAALGGKGIALTCVECNNVSGHKIEADLAGREKINDFIRALKSSEVYSGPVTLEMAGERLNFRVTIEDGPNRKVILTGLGNDPEALERWRAAMDQYVEDGTWDGQQFKITPRVAFNPREAKIAELKAAFLVALAALGYRYVLHERLRPIREQILNPESELLKGFWISLGEENHGQTSLAFVQDPIQLIAVRFERTMILLPWLSGPTDLYRVLRQRLPKPGKTTLSGAELEWPEKAVFKLDFVK